MGLHWILLPNLVSRGQSAQPLTRLSYSVTNKNVGSRLFLMADDSNYQLLNLLNKEFTFDVDVSHLPCGLNGALYLVSMAKDGGASLYPTNKAGAKYGAGYCDAQCPRDLKFINGEVRLLRLSNCESTS